MLLDLEASDPKQQQINLERCRKQFSIREKSD